MKLEFASRAFLFLACYSWSAGVFAQDYPPSPVIEDNVFEDKREISFGDGDNFPVTWADDDRLYTMYCDGVGFDDSIPVDQYLSNGFAELIETDSGIQGRNLPSNIDLAGPTGRGSGAGAKGRKASGLVCINGNLYALVRNLNPGGRKGTGTSLFWSEDKGKTWEECEWNWPEIGIADWLNMGQNYGLNKDGYAYFVTHDGPDAYEIHDSFIMARVPVDRILEESAYEYFGGLNETHPEWTTNWSDRKPVFQLPGKCYRPCLVYNPGIDRFLLFTMPFINHGNYDHYLGVFDAPNPWGPWTVAAEKDDFDEARYHPRVPSKWISEDGLTFQYNFSVLVKRGPPARGFDKSRYKFNLEAATIQLRDPNSLPKASETDSANTRQPETLVNDSVIPGAKGGGMKVHVEAGRSPRSFHVTFEKTHKDDAGAWYTHFDGQQWSEPIQITQEAPFRRGVSMAIDHQDNVHFVWGNEQNSLKYRKLEDGVLDSTETIQTNVRQAEADIAVDVDGIPHVVGHSIGRRSMAVYHRDPNGSWKADDIPDATPAKRWAPSIAITDGAIFVACRSEVGKGPHPTQWWIKQGGKWSNERRESTHKFEPAAIADNGDFLFVAANLRRTFEFFRIAPNAGGDFDVFSRKTKIEHQIARGQLLGLAKTDDGTLFVCHCTFRGGDPNIEGRDITDQSRFFYSISRDNGATWETNLPVGDDSAGQGHGDLAANGNTVMMIWPDTRDGLHLRYNILCTTPNVSQ